MSRRPRVAAAVALAFVLGAAALPAASVGTPIPAPPARFVTDQAGLLAPDAAEQLNQRLEAYQQKTGHQVLVYIDRTTGGVPIEDWAVRAFAAWRVGRKGADDGVALFLFTADRRVRIEVGYGLEPVVPDAVAARIINERMVPRLRAGDGAGAVRTGVEALLSTIGGADAGSPASPEEGPARPPAWVLIVGGVVLLGLLGLLATHPALAAWLIFTIGSGRGGGWGGGGGGGGWGGGGFSGGGGRSGGGGASGSW